METKDVIKIINEEWEEFIEHWENYVDLEFLEVFKDNLIKRLTENAK